jgi:outer membrane protein OmpA-like peptidoglycan-associated protein
MKQSLSILAPSAFALGLLFGCAPQRPPQPPQELLDARAAYDRAAASPGAQHERADLIDARQALDAAEREYADSPDSDAVKTLGYVAQRKAQVAEVEGRATAATLAELEKTEASAGRSERRAKVALDRLGLAAVEDQRGTVITLPYENMFATDEAIILPGARGRLAEIAKAVKQVVAEQGAADTGRNMMLIGYTDNAGTEEHNLDLSRRRADAVRKFFSQHGIDDVMMQTDGRGEGNPVGDNKTAEGRAKNRRVEIVISKPAGSP